MADQYPSPPEPGGLPRHSSFSGRLPSITDSLGDPDLLLRRHSQPHAHIAPKHPVNRLIVPGRSSLWLDGRPLKEYDICGRPFTMQQPPNEGVATFTRQTINGRTLSYRLKVVQQPEKARACGSGPRSSADRRPVDPPPVVKLTVYEGSEDVTLRYDAGFMLYASLDIARPIAGGRMHAGQIVPVLTGVAVAGVAYLERPKQAGYFIFPDLSVRHEGWYRLRFHLFEQVKHAEDADTDRPFEAAQNGNADQPREPIQHEAMANRMFVHSSPFQVFSAKKFPGLNTSTELSKVVADQGCRVRIRREIRQRRKQKGKDDDESDRRSSRATPDSQVRSLHERNISLDGADLSRRMSIDPAHSHILSRRTSAEQLASAPPTRTLSSINSPVASQFSHDSRPFHRPEGETKLNMPSTHAASGLPNAMPSGRDLGGVTLPPLASIYESKMTSPRPRQYNLPESTPQKRSYSPRAYQSEFSLKDGARPDAMAPPSAASAIQPAISRHRSSSTLDFVMNPARGDPSTPKTASSLGPLIEADDDPYAADSDSDCSLLDGPFVYRRADGTKSGQLMVARH